METNQLTKRKRAQRAATIVGAILLIGLIVWLLPRRIDRVVPADGTPAWNADDAPPSRQVVWKSPEEIRNLLPDDPPSTRLATPRLTDAGATLYLTRRDKNGRADIYRARLTDGLWQPAQPVAEVNTIGDEIGPTLSRDGRELFFYSNRPGGQGGFDLYVSTRRKNGWSTPRNLGDRVNSAADEYSPAISADGETLYFASNRTGTADSNEAAKSGRAWSATIRTRRGKRTFDLFAARRDDDTWQTPEPLTRLNRKDSSEGAPFPSPDGAFLYFASDRTSRSGKERNLDLYRARIVDGELRPPENLGPSINTAAHETEPSLSPEGFTLLFSSDRFDGQDRLYSSSAQEVFVEREWSSSHLPVIPSFWWWTLSISLAAAVLLTWLTYRYRDRMLEKVWPARFFLGSVIVNLLLLLMLAVWKLNVIELIARGLSDHKGTGTPGVRGVIDLSETTDGDARKAFERVDDLVPVQQVAEDPQPNPAVNDALAMNRVELSIPKSDARGNPLRPSKNVILVTPDNQRLEPPPKQPKRKQVVKRLALAHREPVKLTSLKDTALDSQRPPEEKKIEQNLTLGRQPRMSRPSSPAVQPKSRMERISPQVTVVELQRAEPSREPPAAAKVSDPQTVRSVTLRNAAKPVTPDNEIATNIATNKTPAEKSVKPPNIALNKTEAASPAAPLVRHRKPILRRAIKVVRIAESPLTIAKSDPAVAKPKSLENVFKPTRKEKEQTSAGKAVGISENQLASITPRAASMQPVKSANNAAVMQKSALPGPSPLKATVKTAQSFNPSAKAVSLDQQSGFEAPRPDPTGRLVRPSPKRARGVGVDALAVADADKKVELQASTSPPPSPPASIEKPLPKTAAGSAGSLVPLKRALGKLRTVPMPFAAKKKSRTTKRPRNTKPDGVKLASLTRAAARGDRFATAREKVDLSTMLLLRSSEIRKKHIEQLGGTKESEKAVNRGLKWLADHQNADGSWSLHRFHLNCKGKHPNCTGLGAEHSDTAATGMALLPFLAAGSTHQKGPYQKTVSRALKWMVDHQKPDGDLLAKGDVQHMYSHGIASIALSEAYGMSRDPQLKLPAKRAIDFIVKAQSKSQGGWRYTPRTSSDTSVVGWQMMALKSGEMAGFNVPKSTFTNVRRWLKSVEGRRAGGGTFGYTSRGTSPAMTAEGLLCLQFMEVPEDDVRLQAGADYLLQNLPKINSNLTSYYWYYGTQVMYHMQGEYWKTWNDRMRDMLAKTQIKTGHLAGTWSPRDRWEQRGGRIYTTAMRVLILEVYYRHLPIYQNGGR